MLQSKEHLELAAEVAAKSFVLLKNDGFLPMMRVFRAAVSWFSPTTGCWLFIK